MQLLPPPRPQVIRNALSMAETSALSPSSQPPGWCLSQPCCEFLQQIDDSFSSNLVSLGISIIFLVGRQGNQLCVKWNHLSWISACKCLDNSKRQKPASAWMLTLEEKNQKAKAPVTSVPKWDYSTPKSKVPLFSPLPCCFFLLLKSQDVRVMHSDPREVAECPWELLAFPGLLHVWTFLLSVKTHLYPQQSWGTGLIVGQKQRRLRH